MAVGFHRAPTYGHKGVSPPAPFDWRGWLKSSLPLLQRRMTEINVLNPFSWILPLLESDSSSLDINGLSFRAAAREASFENSGASRSFPLRDLRHTADKEASLGNNGKNVSYLLLEVTKSHF
ncbi:hypothetical protein J6590_004715 [Homalodisca vitripennis]|nr:hypothetical protein J6590_004715 [Homalodisca vitripennis]